MTISRTWRIILVMGFLLLTISTGTTLPMP